MKPFLLFVLSFFALSVHAADITVQHDGVVMFHATAAPPMGVFDPQTGVLNFTGTPDTPPPATLIPAGMSRVALAALGYDVQWQLHTMTADFTTASSFLGRGAVCVVTPPSTACIPTTTGTDWPHRPVVQATDFVNGAGPVVTLRPTTIVCAKLPMTPSSGQWSNSITPQNNVSGGNTAYRLDITVGDDCTGVAPRVVKLDAYFNQTPVGYTINIQSDPHTLLLDHQYYLGIRLSPARPPLSGPTGPWPVYVIHRTSKL